MGRIVPYVPKTILLDICQLGAMFICMYELQYIYKIVSIHSK